MKQRLIRGCLMTTALVFALGLAAPAKAAKIKLLMGTGPPGGLTFEAGTAMGKVITDNSGGRLEVDTSITGGSTANVRSLQKKDKNQPFRLAMTNSPVVSWAQNGRSPFKKKQDALVLTALFPITVVYATPKDSGIKAWKDLPGKRFVVGSRGGSIYKVTMNALKYSGLKGVKREFFNNVQNVAALKDGRVDAGFFILAAQVPFPVYTDLARTLRGKLNFFGPDEETIKKMVKNDPGIVRDVLPAGKIIDYDKPVVTWGQMYTLLTNSKMSNEVAYLTVKTLMENHTQIERYHPVGKFIRPENGLRGVKIFKFHPGAARYWKEKGKM